MQSNMTDEGNRVCSCNEVDCYWCDDVNPFDGPDGEGHFMPDVIYQQLLWAEQQQEDDRAESKRLYEQFEKLSEEFKPRFRWMVNMKKKIQNEVNSLKETKGDLAESSRAESSHRVEMLQQETKFKKQWIAKMKKKTNEEEKWVNETDAEKLSLLTMASRVEDTIRIRNDYIIQEKDKYPLQFLKLNSFVLLC